METASPGIPGRLCAIGRGALALVLAIALASMGTHLPYPGDSEQSPHAQASRLHHALAARGQDLSSLAVTRAKSAASNAISGGDPDHATALEVGSYGPLAAWRIVHIAYTGAVVRALAWRPYYPRGPPQTYVLIS